MADIVSGITHINGQEIYSYEFIEGIREENVSLGHKHSKRYNICPQAGFQEQVMTCEADVMIIGGRRGSGKTACMLQTPLYNIENPMFTCKGFRKEEGDIAEGLAKTAKQLYTGAASPIKSSFHWTFQSGANVDFDHLQNEAEVDRRFRGVEMPHIIIDEIPQFQVKTIFTLLASNRNTIGVKNKFIGSCNPVGKRHWMYKLLRWYIDEDNRRIDPNRNGRIRYFYKYGETVNEIYWGETKRDVYKKAKSEIDKLLRANPDVGYENFISSFCFIEGMYSDNKIFAAEDPTYLGRLAQQGDSQSLKDINGEWGDDEETESQLSSEEFDEMLQNGTPQTSGHRYATADVALARDFFVLYAFDGRHLYDMEFFAGIGSQTAADMCKKFLEKHNIREEDFAYDTNGIGVYLQELFPKAKGFNARATTTNSKMWDNVKSESAEKFIEKVKSGKYSVNPDILKRKIPIKTDQYYSKNKKDVEETVFWEDRIQIERRALKRKVTDNGRWEIIPKSQMKSDIGHSPDFLEALFMREIFSDTAISGVKNIGMW